jgi:hypothetical protein
VPLFFLLKFSSYINILIYSVYELIFVSHPLNLTLLHDYQQEGLCFIIYFMIFVFIVFLLCNILFIYVWIYMKQKFIPHWNSDCKYKNNCTRHSIINCSFLDWSRKFCYLFIYLFTYLFMCLHSSEWRESDCEASHKNKHKWQKLHLRMHIWFSCLISYVLM